MNTFYFKWISRISLGLSAICFLIVILTRLFLGGWIDLLWWPLALFLIGLVVHIIVDIRMYWAFLTSKTARSGMSFGMSLLTVLVILSCIGYLSVLEDKSFDLTEEKLHSLSPQTISLLQSMVKGDLKIVILYNGKPALAAKNNVRRAFDVYKETVPQLQIESVDALVKNQIAKEYLGSLSQRASFNVFAFAVYQSKKAHIENPVDENSVLKAFTQVSIRVQKNVYFTIGHGEKDFSSQQSSGVSFLKKLLDEASFNVIEWNFIEKQAPLPKDAAALLIIGPTKPFFEQEIKWIREYIQKQGRVFFALDPGVNHNLTPLLKESLSVDFKNNFLWSAVSRLVGKSQSSVFGIQYSPQHPITRLFESLKIGSSIFDEVSEVSISNSVNPQWKTFNLVYSVPAAALSSLGVSSKSSQVKNAVIAIAVQERDEQSQETSQTESKDKKSIERGFAGVVFGDSDFLSNASLGIGIHKDLVLNSISFLADEMNLVSLRPKQPKGTQVVLTQNAQYLFVISSILLPLICFILAGISWWLRKRN